MFKKIISGLLCIALVASVAVEYFSLGVKAAVEPSFIYTYSMLATKSTDTDGLAQDLLVPSQSLRVSTKTENSVRFARFTVTGNDPFIIFDAIPDVTVDDKYILIKYRASSTATGGSLYFAGAEPSVGLDYVSDNTWRTLIVDASTAGANWTNIKHFRLDPFDIYYSNSRLDVQYICFFDAEVKAHTYAGTTYSRDGFIMEYDPATDSLVVTGYSGSGGNITLQSQYEGLTVTTVDSGAFSSLPAGTALTLPSSLTSIADDAFSGVENSITLDAPVGSYAYTYAVQHGFIDGGSDPDFIVELTDTTATVIGYVGDGGNVVVPRSFETLPTVAIAANAFEGDTSITSISFPTSLKSIGDEAFLNCSSLTSATLNDGLESIGVKAFAGCDLTTVSIPASVTSIGNYAFIDNSSLSAINVNTSNEYYSTVDGALLNSFETTLLYVPEANTTYTISSDIKIIGVGAYYKTSIMEVLVPDSVTAIQDQAFAQSSALNGVTVPSSVTLLGENVFTGSDNLTVTCYKSSATHSYVVLNAVPHVVITGNSFIYDVNGDGIINSKDVIELRMYLADSTHAILTSSADIDGNGIIDKSDVKLLAQKVSVVTATSAVDPTKSEIKVDAIKQDGSGDVNMLASRDTFSDTWVSTDNEGRLTIQSSNNPNDKKVGIFYFLWHNDMHSGDEIIDHNSAYLNGGVSGLQAAITSQYTGYSHYWAEPYFGYYRSDDEWIIRKHANQLVAAGVDFVYFDVTNGLIYESVLEKVLSTWNKMRAEGQATPEISFLLNPSTSYAQQSFNALNSLIFSSNRYDDMYFEWEGRPLLLAPDTLKNSLDTATRNKFTFRKSWVYVAADLEWYTSVNGIECWPWSAMYPQGPGLGSTGNVEQMVVMSGFWANGSYGTNAGRSYTNGRMPSNVSQDYSFKVTTSGQGLAFQDQFDYAMNADPDVLMLVGWNEWWAQRQELGAGTGQTIAGSYTVTQNHSVHKYYFVDCFSPEYSRDIEPVKGLFNDNYYYQMAQNIREFKGTRSLQTAFGQKTINVAGDITQWFSVGPEYRDQVGDTAHRNSTSFLGSLSYVNTSGRNDFINAKVSADDNNVYFMAECNANITVPTGTNWMNLFIDADADASTGWYGYDYIINRSRSGIMCSVEKFVDGNWQFITVGKAEYNIIGKYITVSVSRDTIDFADTFDFKWADNSVSDGDVMQFIDMGDAAPSERFNYRYTTAAQAEKIPSVLTDSMIVLKAGSYNAYVNGESVMLDENNTYAVMRADTSRLYLPKAFCTDVLGIDVSDCTVLVHYGTEYVDASTAIESMNKIITRGDNIIVIANTSVSEETLTTLYRSLY